MPPPPPSSPLSPKRDLEAELVAAHDRIAELETLLGLRIEPIPLFGIKKTGWKLLGVFLKRNLVTREFLFDALYGGLSEQEQPNTIRVIDQHVCRLNSKLKPFNVKIKSQVGIGYFLENRAHLLSLMENQDADAF